MKEKEGEGKAIFVMPPNLQHEFIPVIFFYHEIKHSSDCTSSSLSLRASGNLN